MQGARRWQPWARHSPRHLLMSAVAAGVIVSSCSGSESTGLPFVGAPSVAPRQTVAFPTDLAVEPTPTRALRATTTPGGYYKPPGWDGVSDVNCKDFDTHAHAVSFFKGTGGSTTNDPYHLDGNHNGNPCESLP